MKEMMAFPVSGRAFYIGRCIFLLGVIFELGQLFLNREITFINHNWSPYFYLIPLAWACFVFAIADIRPRAFLGIGLIITAIVLKIGARENIFDDLILQFLIFYFLFPLPRWKDLKKEDIQIHPKISVLFIILLGLIYTDSGIVKMGSELWQKGYAVYYGFYMPVTSSGMAPEFLKMKWLLLGLNWLTMVFECTFFLFFFKRLQWVYFLAGLSLHLGTILFLAVPNIGFICTGLILSLLPTSRQPLSALKKENLSFSPSVGLICIIIFAQLFVTSGIYDRLASRQTQFETVLRLALIPTSHWDVFLERHWFDENPNYSIYRLYHLDGDKEVEIPFHDEQGFPQVRNRIWLLTFFARKAESHKETLEYFLKGWMQKNNLKSAEFKIDRKDITIGREIPPLDTNLDSEIKARPWIFYQTLTLSLE